MTPSPRPLPAWRLRALPLALAGLLVALATAVAAAPETPWGAWAALLEAHTRSVPETVGTTVDYRALREPPAAKEWQALLAELARAPEPRQRGERLAFWINAYNILAIDTVLRAWPVESIRDVGSFLRPVWRRDAGVAAGRSVSLHEIEHEILRPLGDPRIHAAIVCASTSCPSLQREPFREQTIDAQLDERMHSWLASPTKGLRIDRAKKRITVSRIFDWFEEDFEVLGGVRAAVTRYAPESDREWLGANAADAELDYFDYDWKLNDRELHRVGTAAPGL